MEGKELKWKYVNSPSGLQHRHGHRAVAIKDLMVVFGGGNGRALSDLCVYNITTNQWFVPITHGDVPPGCAAYGFVVQGKRLLVFGGMEDCEVYSNKLYELQASNWKWSKLTPRLPRNGPAPCPRIGHSFTLVNTKVYLFGGLANDSVCSGMNIPRVMNDLYTLEIKNSSVSWDLPYTSGSPPSPRESHTCVSYVDKFKIKSFLVIYGGMDGCRLGDVWLLDTDMLAWSKPHVSGTVPLPRSLHTSTLIGHRMYVFGGWVPVFVDKCKFKVREFERKCTNTVACLNLESLNWDDLSISDEDGSKPRARAGHCAIGINKRLYIWAGRSSGHTLDNQTYCKDLWYLEVEKPDAPSRVPVIEAGNNSSIVNWTGISSSTVSMFEMKEERYKNNTTPSARPQEQISSRNRQQTPTLLSKPLTEINHPAPVSSSLFAASAPALEEVSIESYNMSLKHNIVIKSVFVRKPGEKIFVSLTRVAESTTTMPDVTTVLVASANTSHQPSQIKLASSNVQLQGASGKRVTALPKRGSIVQEKLMPSNMIQMNTNNNSSQTSQIKLANPNVKLQGASGKCVRLLRTKTGIKLAALPKRGGIGQEKLMPSKIIQMNKLTDKLVLTKNTAGQVPTVDKQQVLEMSSKTTSVNAEPINISMPSKCTKENTKRVTFGGKQVTLKIVGLDETFALRQSQQGEILTLPVGSKPAVAGVSNNLIEQPELMVLSRPKQFTAALASTSFNDPATTNNSSLATKVNQLKNMEFGLCGGGALCQRGWMSPIGGGAGSEDDVNLCINLFLDDSSLVEVPVSGASDSIREREDDGDETGAGGSDIIDTNIEAQMKTGDVERDSQTTNKIDKRSYSLSKQEEN